jgi:hypothetical protein
MTKLNRFHPPVVLERDAKNRLAKLKLNLIIPTQVRLLIEQFTYFLFPDGRWKI